MALPSQGNQPHHFFPPPPRLSPSHLLYPYRSLVQFVSCLIELLKPHVPQDNSIASVAAREAAAGQSSSASTGGAGAGAGAGAKPTKTSRVNSRLVVPALKTLNLLLAAGVLDGVHGRTGFGEELVPLVEARVLKSSKMARLMAGVEGVSRHTLSCCSLAPPPLLSPSLDFTHSFCSAGVTMHLYWQGWRSCTAALDGAPVPPLPQCTQLDPAPSLSLARSRTDPSCCAPLRSTRFERPWLSSCT